MAERHLDHLHAVRLAGVAEVLSVILCGDRVEERDLVAVASHDHDVNRRRETHDVFRGLTASRTVVALCFIAYQNETKRPVFALRARRVVIVLVASPRDRAERAD
jgi:hypothetical protein